MSYRAYLGNTAQHSRLEIIQQGLEYIGFSRYVSRGTSLFLKPNLTFPHYRPGVMTSPETVEAVIVALHDYTDRIYLGESDSGGYNRFNMDTVYQSTGISEFSRRYGVKIVNLSKMAKKEIAFRYKGKAFTLDLPALLTDEIDYLVSIPVPKVHGNTGVSLSFKNQWGCIPENVDRLRLHPYIEHVLLEVNRAIHTRFTIMDGSYGLNRNGPMRGDPVRLDWLMVTDDPGAAARLTCELMQIPLEKIRHLNYLSKQGLIPNRHEIEINTDLAPFIKEKFYLRREITDLPGLMAFRNPFLAWLAYFSPLAGFLHQALNLIREPFYDYTKNVHLYSHDDDPSLAAAAVNEEETASSAHSR